jgi:predicted outer membrane repeat protein
MQKGIRAVLHKKEENADGDRALTNGEGTHNAEPQTQDEGNSMNHKFRRHPDDLRCSGYAWRATRLRLGLLMLVVLPALFVAQPKIGHANVIIVNSDNGSTGCNLASAIENSNAAGQPRTNCGPGSGGDQIQLLRSVGIYLIKGFGGLPNISRTLEIVNKTPDDCAYIEGDAPNIIVNPGATLRLTGVGIRPNSHYGFLSIIYNDGGNLIIHPNKTPCKFSNQEIPIIYVPKFGGTIFNRANGTVTIGGADISDNDTTEAGGTIYNESGVVTISDAGFIGSKTDMNRNISNRGGAIYNGSAGTLRIASNDFLFTGNQARIDGAAIYNDGGKVTVVSTGGPLLLDNRIFDNQAEFGGAIYSNGGTLDVDGIVISSNSAVNGGSGGGIALTNGALATITQTYFFHNGAEGRGAAIYEAANSQTHIGASTFYHNFGPGPVGGSIENDGNSQLSVVNSTFSGESFPRAGIRILSGEAEIVSSTLVETDLDGQVSPTSITLSNSILSDAACANLRDDGFNIQFQSNNCPSSIPTENPVLGELKNNGGPTLTYALGKNSTAIEAIPLADCIDQQGNPIKTDQRGYLRGKHGACSIGAFEFAGTPP